MGLSEFLPFVDNEALDIAAPDVAKCGGLRELADIARVCAEYGVPLAPHNINSPVGTIAGVHAAAAIENVLALEFHAADVPWWSDMVTRDDNEEEIIADGSIRVPESPGLGISVDWDCVAQHSESDIEPPT